jgi:uncharacterized protein with GYD domain
VRDAVIKFAKSVGGKIEPFYFCFGEYDAVAIAEYPTTHRRSRCRSRQAVQALCL